VRPTLFYFWLTCHAALEEPAPYLIRGHPARLRKAAPAKAGFCFSGFPLEFIPMKIGAGMTVIVREFMTEQISNLNLQNAPNTAVEEPIPKFLLKSKGRSHSRAMGDTNLPDLHPLERFDRFFQLLRGQEI
jgi:hypothetical protein